MSSNNEFVSIVDNLDIKIVRFVAQDVYLFDNSTIQYSPKSALHYTQFKVYSVCGQNQAVLYFSMFQYFIETCKYHEINLNISHLHFVFQNRCSWNGTLVFL